MENKVEISSEWIQNVFRNNKRAHIQVNIQAGEIKIDLQNVKIETNRIQIPAKFKPYGRVFKKEFALGKVTLRNFSISSNELWFEFDSIDLGPIPINNRALLDLIPTIIEAIVSLFHKKVQMRKKDGKLGLPLNNLLPSTLQQTVHIKSLRVDYGIEIIFE